MEAKAILFYIVTILTTTILGIKMIKDKIKSGRNNPRINNYSRYSYGISLVLFSFFNLILFLYQLAKV
jgi:hypothetical protein